MRTATNVAGQMVVPTVVARGEGLLDDEVLAQPSAPPLLSGEDDPDDVSSEEAVTGRAEAPAR